MKEKEIGELYREKLADYQSTPPDHLWDDIKKDPAIQKYNKKQQLRKISTYASIAVVIVAVVIIAAIQIFTSDNAENTSKSVAQTENLSSIAPVDTDKVVVSPIVSSQESVVSIKKPITHPTLKAPQFNNVSLNKKDEQSKDEQNSINADNQLDIPTVENHKSSVNNSPVEQSVSISSENKQSQSKNPNNNQTTQAQEFPTFSEEPVVHKTKVGVLKYSGDTSVCRNSEVVLYVENAARVRWSTGSTDPTITIFPEDPMVLYVDVTTYENKDTLVYINVDIFDCELFIPTAFTPNADGLNDEFLVHAPMGITNYECIVFDQASRVLFKSNSITNGWDGTEGGKRLPHGAYFYVITYRDPLNEKHVLKGQVILVR